ncbi:hypothetical protein D3C83_108530 [compost metagenome]
MRRIWKASQLTKPARLRTACSSSWALANLRLAATARAFTLAPSTSRSASSTS